MKKVFLKAMGLIPALMIFFLIYSPVFAQEAPKPVPTRFYAVYQWQFSLGP